MDKIAEKDVEATINNIRERQEEVGLTQLQGWIESGVVWKLEGASGRQAMEYLKSGACFLPQQSFRDYWGNRVPSRDDLQPGTTGTLELSVKYWDEN